MNAWKTFGGACLAVLLLSPGACTKPCDCVPIAIDQHNSVGSFISLSADPKSTPRPVEMGPARIRAHPGENVTWIIRNPGRRAVDVSLHQVFDFGDKHEEENNVRDQVFRDTGGTVSIPPNCDYGALTAVLRDRAALFRGFKSDSCVVRSLNYYFLFVVEGDTARGSIPYDPELIVHGYP